MKCQLVKMSKTRGAAGLLIAAVGMLVSLAVPPSMRGWIDTGAGIAAPPVASMVEASQASPAAAPIARRETARQFHAVADPAAPSGWSSGAIGMCLLAAFSLLLVIAAFFLRSAQAPGARH